jgi:hypothetical protein
LELVKVYTANLASNLTITRAKGSISRIDDIENGKLAYSRIGILTTSSNFYEKSLYIIEIFIQWNQNLDVNIFSIKRIRYSRWDWFISNLCIIIHMEKTIDDKSVFVLTLTPMFSTSSKVTKTIV